mmetsp:Transcript_32562/g.36075  ORF Transcript_32562/g.36075 Transcript_32562/m.36075 type:complete len:88 (-) Transcript_32562:269-532(-)
MHFVNRLEHGRHRNVCPQGKTTGVRSVKLKLSKHIVQCNDDDKKLLVVEKETDFDVSAEVIIIYISCVVFSFRFLYYFIREKEDGER